MDEWIHRVVSHPMTVPEPATFALFALGLLAIGVRRSTGGERTNR